MTTPGEPPPERHRPSAYRPISAHQDGVAPEAGMIGQAELAALAAGSRLFATGAAESSFHLTLDWADAVLDKPVRLVAATDLPPDTLCVAITLVGSTTALGEQLPGGGEPTRAVQALERRLGTRSGAIVALNLAAENALLPLITAATLGLPLVDGDGTGRVFPLVEQTTYTLGGISSAPLALAGPGEELVLIETAPDRVEETLRPVVLSFGGWGLAACYPMRAADLARTLVPGTVSMLMAAGRPGALRSAAAPYGVRRLCAGRIVAVEGSSGHGADLAMPSVPSSIVVEESEGLGRLVRLEAHNEIVLALADGAAVAMAPDQICMISSADGMVVDVDKAEPGMAIEVLVLPAAPAWHTDEGRALGGLRAFGVPL